MTAGPIAVFNIKTQFENLGDALINRELIRGVSRHACCYVNLSRCPPKFVASLSLQNTPNVRVLSSSITLLAMAIRGRVQGRTVFYFLSPGGYHGELGRLGYTMGLVKLAMLRVLSALGLKVVLLGVSYERLGVRQARLFSKRSRILHAHLVRDWQSAKDAQSWGMKIDGVIPDLAFGADVLPQSSAPRKWIAISFRCDQYAEQANEWLNVISSLDRGVASYMGFRFVCQVERDREQMEKAHASLKSGRPSEFISNTTDISKCIEDYSECGCVVSNRLHSLIIGSLAGSGTIAVVDRTFNRKIAALLEILGASASMYDVKNSADARRMVNDVNDGRTTALPAVSQQNSLRLIFTQILTVESD